MKAETAYSECGVHAISKWSPVVLEMRKKEKSLGVLKRAAVPRRSRTSSYNSSWHTMKTPFKAPNYRLSPQSKTLLRWTASPLFPFFFFFVFFSFFFRKNSTRRIDQRQGYRRSTFHPSSPREKWGAVRIQQSRSYLQPMALKDAGAGWSPLWAACVVLLMRLKDSQNSAKTAGKWWKRQKEECVGETARGSRSHVCFILSQNRQNRKTCISLSKFDPNMRTGCFKCLKWVTAAVASPYDFYRGIKIDYLTI